MWTESAIKFFGSKKALAEKLKRTQGRISQLGPIMPPAHAKTLHFETKGKLNYSQRFYDRLAANKLTVAEKKRLKRLSGV